MKLGDPIAIGALLKKKRLDLGWTLREMAEATGLSFVTILRLEKGRIGYIHSDTFKKLEALKMNEELLKRRVMRLVPVEPTKPAEKPQRDSGDMAAMDRVLAGSPKAQEALKKMPHNSRKGLKSLILRAVRTWADTKIKEETKES